MAYVFPILIGTTDLFCFFRPRSITHALKMCSCFFVLGHSELVYADNDGFRLYP